MSANSVPLASVVDYMPCRVSYANRIHLPLRGEVPCGDNTSRDRPGSQLKALPPTSLQPISLPRRYLKGSSHLRMYPRVRGAGHTPAPNCPRSIKTADWARSITYRGKTSVGQCCSQQCIRHPTKLGCSHTPNVREAHH